MKMIETKVSVVKVSRKIANVVVNGNVVNEIRFNGDTLFDNDMCGYKDMDDIVSSYKKQYKTIEVKDNLKTEWIVEKNVDGILIPIGKLIGLDTQFLSNYELEEVWELVNYGSSQPQKAILVGSEIYHEGFISSEYPYLVYTPIKNISCANCDLFIRKHYDIDNGFFLLQTKTKEREKWVYGDRKEAMVETSKKPY